MPLTEKIRMRTDTTFKLYDLILHSFNDIKYKISEVLSLAHQRSDCTDYRTINDSTNYTTGATIHQVVDGATGPIGFVFKKLTQTRYSALDKERFAAYSTTL